MKNIIYQMIDQLESNLRLITNCAVLKSISINWKKTGSKTLYDILLLYTQMCHCYNYLYKLNPNLQIFFMTINQTEWIKLLNISYYHGILDTKTKDLWKMSSLSSRRFCQKPKNKNRGKKWYCFWCFSVLNTAQRNLHKFGIGYGLM